MRKLSELGCLLTIALALAACSERELFAVRAGRAPGPAQPAPMGDAAQPMPDASSTSDAGSVPEAGPLDAGSIECDVPCASASEACVLGRCVRTAEAPSLAVGNAANCVLRAAGALFCWGRNSDGELGLGDNTARYAPVSVSTPSDFVEVAAGVGQHFCAIAGDRSLWCWGNNYAGALGLGDQAARLLPTRVGTRNDWLRAVPDSGHSCWLDAARATWCVGRNADGELGVGDKQLRSEPIEVTGAGPFEALSAGWGHTCGLARDGSLWCWGRNAEGQLGLGDNQPRLVPARLEGRWLMVSARGTHTCALREDNSLWCWGGNDDGELGVGDASARNAPTRAATDTRFSQVSNGYFHTCAIALDHTLWCWGERDFRSPGLADASDVITPAQLGSAADWSQVSAGYGHGCALKEDLSVWCWGLNELGQLGQGDMLTRLEPTLVPLPSR